MSNVVALHGCDPVAPGPVDSVVQTLELLLERARDGQIVAVAVALEDRDGDPGHVIAGVVSRCQMIGALLLMQHQLIADVEADE